jgi:hypothetical protein
MKTYSVRGKDVLTMVKVLKVWVLKNNTDKKIIHSPEYTDDFGVFFDEIVVNPGEMVCCLNQDFSGAATPENAIVVVAPEFEMIRLLGLYFHDPYLLPGFVGIENGRLTVAGIPVTPKVLREYPNESKEKLKPILIDLLKKKFTKEQRSEANVLLYACSLPPKIFR